MYAMKLKPVGKDYLWGGTKLREKYNKNIALTPLAETWECSTHKDGLSIVDNGIYRGQTLKDVLKLHPEYMGENTGGELPVLVKLIDAAKDLSIQVHPDDEYAQRNENQSGKNEMWYVLEAEEGATLVYGFEHDVTKEQIRRAIERGKLEKHLHREPVHKGDVFYIPSGTVHGIGKGVIVAEIQQSSNVTYRLYDYNRTDKFGNKRELHIEKALDVLDMSSYLGKISHIKELHCYPNMVEQTLCKSKFFTVKRLCINGEVKLNLEEDKYHILLCTEGSLTLSDGINEPLDIQKGDCAFIPKGMGEVTLCGSGEMLLV